MERARAAMVCSRDSMFDVLGDLAETVGLGFASPAPAPATPAPAAPSQQHHRHHHQQAAPADEGLLDIVGHTLTDVGRDLDQTLRLEGSAAFTDSDGAADRYLARQQLADRFRVVPDGQHGRRAPNTVTEAEYQDIAHLYSDIRLGRGDLTIDPARTATVKGAPSQLPVGDRAGWQTGVMDDIASLLQTRTGRAELSQLHSNPLHHHTTIAPHLMSRGDLDPSNATAIPTAPLAARQIDGHANTGSDVVVSINPGDNLYVGDDQERFNPWMRSMRSDVSMIHELTHALYATLGQEDATGVTARDAPAHHHATSGVRADARYRERVRAPDGTTTTVPLSRAEHQAVGIGNHARAPWGENRYRHERRQLARMHAPGVQLGTPGEHDADADMTLRDTYVGHHYHH